MVALGEKKKQLLFKFPEMQSAHLLHSAPHWDTYRLGDAPWPQTSSSHCHPAAHHRLGPRNLFLQKKKQENNQNELQFNVSRESFCDFKTKIEVKPDSVLSCALKIVVFIKESRHFP